MLKTRSVSSNTVAWIILAAILVVALGAILILKPASPAVVAGPSDGNPVSVSLNPAPAALHPSIALSPYISAASLRRWLDEAYEKHQTSRIQTLLGLLNGRYEHRCCGLPR